MKITLPLPPSVNRIYRTGQGRFYKASVAKDWEEGARWLLKSRWTQLPFKKKVYLGIDYFFSRDSDIGNRDKILEDILQGVAYENDRQIWHKNVTKGMDKKNPRVEIQIEELG